jgi:hypothetical protein
MTGGVKNWIYLEDHIDVSKVKFIENVVSFVYPNNVLDIPDIYFSLKNASLSNGHWHVWLKSDVPEYFYYNNSLRIGPIVLLPDAVCFSNFSNYFLNFLKGMGLDIGKETTSLYHCWNAWL